MASKIPGCHGFPFHDPVFLVFSREEEIPGEDFFGPLLPILRENDMAAGVSSPFSSPGSLREYASRYRGALRPGMAPRQGETLYFYKDCTVCHMTEICLRNEHVSTFRQPEALRLAEHERGGRTDLPDTLKAYLYNGRGGTETARVPDAHLSTVKYRPRRIWDIIGADPDEDDNALEIMLSFKTLEYREKFRAAGTVTPFQKKRRGICPFRPMTGAPFNGPGQRQRGERLLQWDRTTGAGKTRRPGKITDGGGSVRLPNMSPVILPAEGLPPGHSPDTPDPYIITFSFPRPGSCSSILRPFLFSYTGGGGRLPVKRPRRPGLPPPSRG